MPQVEEEAEKQREVADENKRKQSENKNKNAPHVCQKLKFTTLNTALPAQSRWFLFIFFFLQKFIQARRQQSKTKLGVVQRGGGGKILFVHCLGGTASAFGQKFR